jgi:MFS family permease
MYSISSSTAVLRVHRRLLSRERGAGAVVARTVVLLGITSLITDISSEMVSTVLPLYLIYIGGFTPLAFGLIDGIYNGATAFVGIAAGYAADRWRRHKAVAATGYGLSAICKLGLVAVGTALSAIGAVVLFDRIGKGIRTAPRDAMISLATPKESLGTAFGVHRALDTTGAMIGPLLAFAILAVAPVAFNSIFVVSFLLATIGVAVLVLFVQPRDVAPDAAAPARPTTLRGAAALLALPRYRALLIAGGALSLATASDAFIYLVLQHKLHFANSLFPLLYVGSSTTFMVLAAPFGRFADRVGRGKVLLGGYGLLLAVYLLLLAPLGGWQLAVLALGLLGTYYAATDGVLMALGSAIVPAETRTSGLALLGTVTSGGRLVASLAFGALWTLWGSDAAVGCFVGGLLAAATLASVLLLRRPQPADASA